jgi:hypothetical protein
MSLIKRIEEDITNGKTASEAIACLESARDGRTLPQLQVALRPKGRKGRKAIGGDNNAMR